MISVQVLNHIAHEGLSTFCPATFQIHAELQNPSAILLRSENLHNKELPPSVIVVGRAGAGTNNIPVDYLTRLGIPVLNTPGANANAVKELVLTGMLMASRHIYPALNFTQSLHGNDQDLHKAVEAQKKQFVGSELAGKTLGIIGLGAIGVKVANAALALEMNVIGFDPAISVQRAWELSSNVKQAKNFEDLLRQSDFLTCHVPLNSYTENMINAESFSRAKPELTLLNFARQGIINEEALLEALNQNKVKCYISDFPSVRFKNHPKVLALPHLGASTLEAEINCAVMISDQVQDFLLNGNIRNSVNFPETCLDKATTPRLCIVNKNIPNMVGQITTTLAKAQLNIVDMLNKSRGDIAYTLIDLEVPASSSVLEALSKINGVIKVRQVGL